MQFRMPTLIEYKINRILRRTRYLNLAKDHNLRAVLEVKTVEGSRQSVNRLKERISSAGMVN